MKEKIIFSLLLIRSIAQAQLPADWSNYPGGVSIATDAANNSYTANWDYNPAGDITLTKRNASGSVLWNASFNNTDNTRHEVATWVETDNSGNILVSGTIRSGYSNPVNAASLLMKFNASGNLLWRVVFESSFDGSYTRKCLVDAGNNIYVLGVGSGPGGFVTKVKKFNPSGVSLWSYFDNAGIGAAINFKFTPDSCLLISGRGITGSINGYAKIDLNGNNIWNHAGINSLTTGDAAGDASGNAYLINGAYTSPGSILKKISPTGIVLWNDTNLITAYRVEVGSDNYPVICGFPSSGSGGAAFMKFDAGGNMIWQNLDADGPSFSLLMHAQMKLDASNAAYLAAGTLFEMAICKVNSNGSSSWTGTAPGGHASAFAIGADHNIYVTGGTTARFIQAQPCLTPSGTSTAAITASQVRLKWNLIPGAVQYEVWYKKAAASKWKKRFVNGQNKSITVKNLLCNTSYEWKIRTLCDTIGVDEVSSFSPVISFSTVACRYTNSTPEKQLKTSVYPNPAADYLTLSSTISCDGKTMIRIYNASGSLVMEKFISDPKVDVRALNNGFYYINIITAEKVLNSKFIIEKGNN